MTQVNPLACFYCGEVFATPFQRSRHEELYHEGTDSGKMGEFWTGEPMDLAFRLLKKEFNPQDYVEDMDLYCDLDNYHDTHSCFDFAEMFHQNLKEGGIESQVQSPSNDPYAHRWVYVPSTNLHYDAHSVNIDNDGYKDWRDLPYWNNAESAGNPHEMGEAMNVMEGEHGRDLYKSEPMDLAFRLLKYPVQTTLPQFAPNMGPPIMAVRGMSPDRARQAMAYGLKPSPKYPVEDKPAIWSVGGAGPKSQREASQYGRQLVGIRQGAFPAIPHDVGPEGVPIYAHSGDIAPSDLVMLMLKHATSPEALRHKREYDAKYESTPERVKYRSDLKQARRKRNIEGKGGPDMSHTQSGSIVAEDPHSNRARHFKGRGTLKPE